MFRNIIVFILFYSIGLSAFSQQKTFDILYLKDGSVLKGEIIELILNQKVVFRLRNNQTIEIRYQEIEKIAKEEREEEDNPNLWDTKAKEGREEKDDLNLWETKRNEERTINAKFKGLNFVILNATVGVTRIEEEKISNLSARNQNDEIGYEVGAQYLNMFSRRWGLGMGLGVANYTAQIPYYTDSFQRLYRYKIQDFYYLNIPVYFKFLTSRPETVNMYLDLGLEPSISFSKPAVSESIEINRMKLNFLFGIGIRIPFNQTLSANIGYRSLSSITNAGWSDYLSQFSLEYSALQVSLMLQPWALKSK